MTTKEISERFRKQLTSTEAILDSGFGELPGESNRLYKERKEMAEAALTALLAQQASASSGYFCCTCPICGTPLHIKADKEPEKGDRKDIALT